MANLFQHLNTLKNNVFGGGQSTNNISYGGGVQQTRERELGIADTSPVARLNKDPLGFSSLSYPKDLINDITNGHYMLFYINQQTKSRYEYTRASDGATIKGTTYKQKTENRTTTTTGAAGQTYTRIEKVPIGQEEVSGGGIKHLIARDREEALKKQRVIDSSDVAELRKQKTRMKTGLAATGAMMNNTTRITDSVAIYLPPNVQDNYTTSYNATETGILGFLAASGGAAIDAYKGNDFKEFVRILTGTAGGALEEVLKNVGSGIVETLVQAEGGYELANKVFGRSTNPYMEVLFGGPELRTFTYNFTFAPKNKEEQDEVREIIKLFRFHQAPELRSSTSMFMGLPSEFDIHYMYQPFDGTESKENTFYNKIATCVLQSVNVDYTPGAVNSHDNGAPVVIKMGLNFLETEMITKDHVEAGY